MCIITGDSVDSPLHVHGNYLYNDNTVVLKLQTGDKYVGQEKYISLAEK